MLLALDVGNSQIYGGVFATPGSGAEKPKLQFRRSSKHGHSADEMGLFLLSVLRENGIDPKAIAHIALCSVVPDLIHSIKGACTKYFGRTPLILQAGTKTGLKIRYNNPLEVGADRIANSIAGIHLFPGKNLIIADFGTATTFDLVTSDRDYLGGMILPGFRISMEALESNTARLPAVEMLAPQNLIGKSTVESIQSGLYFSNLYATRGITERIKKEVFGGAPTVVIGTGGFSRMFDRESPAVFDELIPELVLTGLHRFYLLNQNQI